MVRMTSGESVNAVAQSRGLLALYAPLGFEQPAHADGIDESVEREVSQRYLVEPLLVDDEVPAIYVPGGALETRLLRRRTGA